MTRELEHLNQLSIAWQYWQAEVCMYMYDAYLKAAVMISIHVDGVRAQP